MNFFKVLPFLLGLVLSGCGESSSSSGSSGSDSQAGGGTGQSGSLAAMQVLDGNLHILTNHNIKSFSLSSPLHPELIGSTSAFEAETLFNYQNEYLFVGTSTGVLIYQQPDAEEDKSTSGDYLNYVNQFAHIRAYDPVIAFSGQAYFTTRDGVEGNLSNFTDYVGLLNIEDMDNPYLLAEYHDLIEPVGLAQRDGILYICDKVDGLSLFTTKPSSEASNNNNLDYTLVPRSINDFVACTDIIATDDQLILTSPEGVAQIRIEYDLVSQLSLIRNKE